MAFTDHSDICVCVYTFYSSVRTANFNCLRRTAVFKINFCSGTQRLFVDSDELLSFIDCVLVVKWARFVINKLLAQEKLISKPRWTKTSKPFEVYIIINLYWTIDTILPRSNKLFSPVRFLVPDISAWKSFTNLAKSLWVKMCTRNSKRGRLKGER